jgi:hypothetical protein
MSRADMVLTFTGTSVGVTSSNLSIGWEFETNQGGVTVTALGAFIRPGGADTNVRIYDGLGNVIVSANVLASDPLVGTATAQFHSHAVTPVILAANADFFIAADLAVGQSYSSRATGLTTNPFITYLHGDVGLGLGTDPTANPYAYMDPGYFGPNFEGIVTPEPASIVGVVTAALVGLGVQWHRRRRGLVAWAASQ